MPLAFHLQISTLNAIKPAFYGKAADGANLLVYLQLDLADLPEQLTVSIVRYVTIMDAAPGA